jgi:hypothetical protein
MTNMSMEIIEMNDAEFSSGDGFKGEVPIHLKGIVSAMLQIGGHPDITEDDIKEEVQNFTDGLRQTGMQMFLGSIIIQVSELRNTWTELGNNKRNKGWYVFKNRADALTKYLDGVKIVHPQLKCVQEVS